MILLVMRVNQVPDARVAIRMDCEWPCTGELDVTEEFSQMPVAAWQRVAIPLDCFAAAGTDLNAVDVPLVISTAGALTLDLAEVTITDDSADAQRVACSAESLVGVNPKEA